MQFVKLFSLYALLGSMIPMLSAQEIPYPDSFNEPMDL